MNLLQMSISGAVMILVIIVIRALAINRLPKKTFIALWGIVLLRLLVPFSFPSPFSAYSIMNRHITTPKETGEIVRLLPVSPVVVPTNGNVLQGQPMVNISPYMIVWAIGMIVCALFFAISYFKFRREFRESLPVKNDFLTRWIAEHKLTRQIEIRQSCRISAPLTYGVFKPIILMPKNTNWNDPTQIEYILAHEFVHIRHFDAATKLFLTAALCIHWFNPLVLVMYILSNRDIELSCDETVVHSFGDTIKSAYALTLISMEEKKNDLTPLCNNFSKNAIEERITAIMKIKKTSVLATLIAFCLIIGVTTAFATSNSTISPIRISDKDISPGGKISFGSQHFVSSTECQILLTWTGNSKLTVICTSSSGAIKSLPAKNGKATTLQIDTGGEYTISVRNDNAHMIENVNGTIEFKQSIQSQQSQNSNILAGLNTSNMQTVTYENVEMRRYDGYPELGIDGHPYAHDVKTNNTDKMIVSTKIGMTAFDKDGNPLIIKWNGLDSSSKPSYYFLYDWGTEEILPHQTNDVFGGWSLNESGLDPNVAKIAYVLYCDKEITFEDGTVWTNPDFNSWRLTYEGKKINVNILKNYYPYKQIIDFTN